MEKVNTSTTVSGHGCLLWATIAFMIGFWGIVIFVLIKIY